VADVRPGPGGPGAPAQGAPEARTLCARFTARPGCEQRVAELLRDLTRSVRQEPGNLRFDPYTQVARPAEFFVFEVYRDEAAFQAHLGADHGARFNAALADLILEDASVLSWLHPVA
jgi:quinol monooxygenase YgiN